MNNDLKKILSNSNKEIDNQQLMDYLSRQLSKAEMHEVERGMADDEFMNDALEGLEDIQNKQNIPMYVEQLNNELKNNLAKKKSRREKRRWKDQPFVYIAIILILLLLILSFIVIKTAYFK